MVKTSKACSCPSGIVDIQSLCEADNTTAVLKNYPYWKQMYISETLVIPEVKPNAEQINSVNTMVNILKAKVIKTPRSYNDLVTPPVAIPNMEGRVLTGRKLIIEGQLCQVIEYTAAEETQPVHSVEFFVPFSSFIVVPQMVTIGAEEVDSLNVTFDVNSCIEDVTACLLNERIILKQVTLLISAVPVSIN